MAAEARLRAERSNWRKERPPLFVAKPKAKADGTSDLFNWEIKVPAAEKSVWYPAFISGTMSFSTDYPQKPPKVKFDLIDGKPLFHPNVYRDGGVCLSIINPENSTHGYGKGGDWEPTLTIKHVMEALQVFLDEATGLAAGRNEEYQLWKNDRAEFNRRVKLQVAKCEEQPSGP